MTPLPPNCVHTKSMPPSPNVWLYSTLSNTEYNTYFMCIVFKNRNRRFQLYILAKLSKVCIYALQWPSRKSKCFFQEIPPVLIWIFSSSWARITKIRKRTIMVSNYQVCGTKVIGWEILAFTREPHRADLTGTGPLGPKGWHRMGGSIRALRGSAQTVFFGKYLSWMHLPRPDRRPNAQAT